MHRNLFPSITYLLFCLSTAYCKDITPRKFTGTINTTYRIPVSCRFTVPRTQKDAPSLVYYLFLPNASKSYPLTVLCTGSSTPAIVKQAFAWLQKELLKTKKGYLS